MAGNRKFVFFLSSLILSSSRDLVSSLAALTSTFYRLLPSSCFFFSLSIFRSMSGWNHKGWHTDGWTDDGWNEPKKNSWGDDWNKPKWGDDWNKPQWNQWNQWGDNWNSWNKNYDSRK